MGLYDGWSLPNSRTIPQYQGSAVPELNQVAGVMQERYDTGRSQADLIDQMIKTSTAAPQDQPVLSSLKTQYRGKLQDYADKGNYESMWRDVAMDARDFQGHVKNIQANQSAIQGWQADLNKRVNEGKLDPAVAKARIAQMNDTYGGLKMDPETGQLTNFFSGSSTVPSIDIPEKVNKWLQDSHAIERGWKAERDVNGWYITNGTERKSLPWNDVVGKDGKVMQAGLKGIIDSGIALDPEVKGWLSQEYELAPYYQGVSSKLSPGTVQQIMLQSPQLGAMIKQKIDSGLAPAAALHAVLGDDQVRRRVEEIYGYARKGVVDEQKGEYGEKMDPITEEMAKKRLNQDHLMFSVPFTDVSPGIKITSVDDFKTEQGKLKGDVETAARAMGAFRNQPGETEHDGRAFRLMPDGTTVDVTEDLNKLRQGVKAAQDRVDQMEMVRKAAADAVGYHPEDMSASTRKKAQQAYNDTYQAAERDARTTYDREGNPMRNTKILQGDDFARIEKQAQDARQKVVETDHPAYKDYEQELIKRLQPQGEGNKIWVFNDDKMKKSLGDFADAAITNLGLDKGLVSLKVASGKNQGQDLSASDYDDLQGKFAPVGIYNDAKTGQTKIMLRALQDIKGKKIKGENLVVSMQDVGAVDDYMRVNNSPGEYNNFVMGRVLKSGMNNTAGTMNYPIKDDKGVEHGAVQITRKRGSNQGPGSFSMRVQTPSGWRQQSFDSYEGVIEKLQQIQELYNGRNNTTPNR